MPNFQIIPIGKEAVEGVLEFAESLLYFPQRNKPNHHGRSKLSLTIYFQFFIFCQPKFNRISDATLYIGLQ